MKLSEQVALLERENERLQALVDAMADELAKELAKLPHVDPEYDDYVAQLEALVELVAPDIEFKEQHLSDSMERTKAIVDAYRAIRPKEAKRADWSVKAFGPADDQRRNRKLGKYEQAFAYFEDAIKESDEIIADYSPDLQAELTEQKGHFEVALAVLEKQVPKKVIPNKRISELCKCPICKTELCSDDKDLHYCPTCGQALQV